MNLDIHILNIFNYLALDVHLGVAQKSVKQLAAFDAFPGFPEVLQPFARLAVWDRETP